MDVALPNTREHWEGIWARNDPTRVSWFEAIPASLALVRKHAAPGDAVIDIGGGSSRLVDALLAAGYRDVTVLDIAQASLDGSRARLDGAADQVTWVVNDLLDWTPERRRDLWHDRAVLHFLTADADVDRYVSLTTDALTSEGRLVISAFGPEGPTTCSGLPVRRWDGHDLAARFGSGFRLMSCATFIHSTPSGHPQQLTTVALRRA